MTERELLPCPFCGGEAERVDINDGENAGGSCISCTACQASSNLEFGRKENFVSNWNRRASRPDEGEAVAWRYAALETSNGGPVADRDRRWSYIESEPFAGPQGGEVRSRIIIEPLYAHPPRSPEPLSDRDDAEGDADICIRHGKLSTVKLYQPDKGVWAVYPAMHPDVQPYLRLASPEPWRAPEGFDRDYEAGRSQGLMEARIVVSEATQDSHPIAQSIADEALSDYADAMISAAPPAPLPGKDTPPIDTEEVGS